MAALGTFDVLVLGGGTAGCVLAGRLSEERYLAVCLVEAGPDYGPRAARRWPEDMLDARILPFSHSWARLDESDRSQHRARIIGGCCGTSAAHVRAMAEALAASPKAAPPSYEEIERHLGPIRKVTTTGTGAQEKRVAT